MTPGHDHPAQSGPAPGVLRVGRGWVAPGQLLSLELATPDNSTFKGFIIQARDAQLKDQQVGGRKFLMFLTYFLFCLFVMLLSRSSYDKKHLLSDSAVKKPYSPTPLVRRDRSLITTHF